MKYLPILIVIFSSLPWVVLAQTEKHRSDNLALNIGAGSYRGTLCISYDRTWRLGKSQRLGIGLGARLTSFLGSNVYYVTAPAELTTGSASPLIIFQENIAENIDSLLIQSPQVNSINLFINIDYRLSKRMVAGFSIDAIGYSFGAEERGNFMSGASGKNTTAKPTSFNILLISDNDKGSLNSDLYIKYFLSDRFAIRAGAQFLFTEYTTREKVQQLPSENDRFRNKSLLASLGVSLKL
jgi:hypothetical protein